MTISALGSHNAFSTTSTFTCANSAAASTLCIVVVNDNTLPASPGTLTDSVGGNTWTAVIDENQTSGANVIIFYSILTNPLTTSSTVTYTASTTGTINTWGIIATGYVALDAATTAGATTFSAAYSVTGAGSASVANELYIGAAQGSTPLTATGFTVFPGTAPNVTLWAGYQVNSGTSALTFAGTVTSSWWVAAIASFTPASVDVLFPQIVM